MILQVPSDPLLYIPKVAIAVLVQLVLVTGSFVEKLRVTGIHITSRSHRVQFTPGEHSPEIIVSTWHLQLGQDPCVQLEFEGRLARKLRFHILNC